MYGWDAVDQLEAITSVLDDRERCPGCGLRPDQHPHVIAELTYCAGCDAKQAIQATTKETDRGLLSVFTPVEDSRASLWARLTSKGRQWASTVSDQVGPQRYIPDD